MLYTRYFSIGRGPSSEDMFKFADIVELQGKTEEGTAESICDTKENTHETETENASVEEPLNTHRTTSMR